MCSRCVNTQPCRSGTLADFAAAVGAQSAPETAGVIPLVAPNQVRAAARMASSSVDLSSIDENEPGGCEDART
jgi:hypothetical protein